MKKRDPIVYISDMLNSSESAIAFIKGLNYKSFSTDQKTLFAVIRAIEIIGEASNKVPKNLKVRYADVPWREIGGMRNKLIHEYFGIDSKVVWKTIKNDLPLLKKHLELIYKDLSENQKFNF
jgi:uncharacterized protein with HEPN domain